MSNYTITIKGDYSWQELTVTTKASDEQIESIKRYILRKLSEKPTEDK